MENRIITEDHPVVEDILDSKRLNSERKLLAISELLYLEQIDKLWGSAIDAYDIDEMFEWEDSELGVEFWADIQDDVFEPQKRTC